MHQSYTPSKFEMINPVKKWFLRSSGSWNSNRRYWYAKTDKNQVLNSELNVQVEDIGEENFKVSLTWDSKEGDKGISEGEMLCEYDSDSSSLRRNIGYMTKNETVSKVTMVDSDTVLLETEYSGMKFREEIRLLGNDVRLRQTVGWKDGAIILVGQYFEQRT